MAVKRIASIKTYGYRGRNNFLSVDYKIDLFWDTGILEKYRLKLHEGAKRAGNVYLSLLRLRLKRTSGSVPAYVMIGPNYRKAVKFSRPGEIPFWQTKNLANSVNLTDTPPRPRDVSSTVRLSTRVKYARSLERGGYSTNEAKPYTTIQLINNFPAGRFIAPRPVWLPLLLQYERRLVKMILQAGQQP